VKHTWQFVMLLWSVLTCNYCCLFVDVSRLRFSRMVRPKRRSNPTVEAGTTYCVTSDVFAAIAYTLIIADWHGFFLPIVFNSVMLIIVCIWLSVGLSLMHYCSFFQWCRL
jgi:hypothetical protein